MYSESDKIDLYSIEHKHVSQFTRKNDRSPLVRLALPTMREIPQGETNVILVCAFKGTSTLADINWSKDNQLIVVDGLENKTTVIILITFFIFFL